VGNARKKQKSELAHKAFLAYIQCIWYTWVVIITGYKICEFTHLAGISEAMSDVDRLSRCKNTVRLDRSTFITTSSQKDLNGLFELLDPRANDTEVLTAHMETFHKVISLVSKVLRPDV
jgi:hypothetical protein